jgi:hypothetical protein
VLEIARRCARKVDAGVVIATRSDLDHMNGLSDRNSGRMEALELHTYVDLQKTVFYGVRKLNVVADPSSYQGQETMVAVLYTWEKDMAGVGPTVLVPAGKRLIPEQWEHMPDQVKEALANRRTERLASLKEWRALSWIIWQYTGLSLDDFDIPPDCAIRCQLQNEQRLKIEDFDAVHAVL